MDLVLVPAQLAERQAVRDDMQRGFPEGKIDAGEAAYMLDGGTHAVNQERALAPCGAVKDVPDNCSA